MLSGVLERAPQPRTDDGPGPDATPAEATTRGRGVAPAAKPSRVPAARTAKRIKGRTVYLADDLFERVIVQAHRRDLTISDYIATLLERHVPDHRRIVQGPAQVAVEPEEDREG